MLPGRPVRRRGLSDEKMGEIVFADIVKKIQSISPEELAAAHDDMLDRITDWVTTKYPNISLAIVERNLQSFLRIQEYDNICTNCFGTSQCPSQDGNRMNGRLDADGVVTIWMDRCPHGYRPPKGERQEPEKKRWSKNGKNDD